MPTSESDINAFGLALKLRGTASQATKYKTS